MNNLKHKALVLPITGALLLALAGCGSTKEASAPAPNAETSAPELTQAPVLTVPDADVIFPKVTDTVKKATSVALEGTSTSGPKKLKIKVSGSRDGTNSLSEVTQDGATVTLLNADGGAYIKADNEFFVQKSGQQTADLVKEMAGNKWISVKDTSVFGDRNIGSFLGIYNEKPVNDGLGKLASSSVADLNGAQAFKYVYEEATVWIAAEGEPYLLQFGTTGKDAGTITMSEWNAVAPHAAPAKNDTVTIPGL
ncbi:MULTISPECIES: hypothetical protein [Arthrobacter]|uniref:hypothetical protein n=1 Tax=unclassified Arthrobacter TaxID=235627 RepID=UPI0024BB399B|nr:hypothetical protein [Arthrobacter sp. H35-MC1]MDJ0316109.1 hypothetical protein [Arthrobacter sp. H35-MC1]